MKHPLDRSLPRPDSRVFRRRALAGLIVVAGLLLSGRVSVRAETRASLSGHVPAAVANLSSVGRLPVATNLSLAIGIPLRNTNELDTLLAELHNPASTNFQRWLTPDQFTERFGPTAADYQKVVDYAQAQGFKVTGKHANRLLLDVAASVTNIERTFKVNLRVYPHPRESRNFYAPDREPQVETNVPILHISGLDNYARPYRLGGAIKALPLASSNGITAYATGSSPGGYFMGNDFRKAYVPGVTNTGAGQYIAIVDVGGPYYTNDIYMYETNAGLSTSITISNILLSGWSGIPTGTNDDEGEEVLDIDMAMSMAPGATILNYEGEAHDVFNQIAVDNKAKQMTLSYGFGIDSSIIQMFRQFAAQGQSFSQASGDGGADPDGGVGLTGNPYATIVGGASLTTSSAGGPWQSDVTWGGSGGGISGYGIPSWQQGITTLTNQASTAWRNYPDVSMPAVNIFTVYRNGTAIGATGGTSAASPLWAGFMALVNQSAAALGKPAAGLVNPAIYTIGKGNYAAYTNCFHDITTGNTVNSHNPTRFYAGPGYDLCTGWGTPTGSNTISALLGIGTNDFMLYTTRGSITTVRGGGGGATITITPMNGFAGKVNLAVSGLPPGVTATLGTTSTTSNSLVSIITSNTTPVGNSAITITGTYGSLTHATTIGLTVVAAIPGSAQVALASYYNRTGIYTDGLTFGSGFDGVGYACSANLLEPSATWNNALFNLGPANASDVISCSGQTVTLPAGQFSALQLLATGINGSQSAQTFMVTYTDNSTTNFSQRVSDWYSPQNFSGEDNAIAMPYRNWGGGSQVNSTFYLYGYIFFLNPAKTVKSLTLPANGNVIVLAATLANEPVPVSLSAAFNRVGLYSDGTNFSSSGGADLGGAAYSATLLGSHQTWTNTQFAFGPPNVSNIISAAAQTIALPAGKYSALRMLASGVQGSQTSQTFTISYTDSTTASVVQSLSDWYSPQNYAGEAKAFPMAYRNSSGGTADNRTFYLYGYSFALNSSKTVQSIRLPSNGNVLVAAISLVPNWAPAFTLNPFNGLPLSSGQGESGTISTNASDLNGDTLTFAKSSGPAWLTVALNGTLSGTPYSANVGTNTFVVSATDTGGLSGTATFTINVLAVTPTLSLGRSGSNLVITWTNGLLLEASNLTGPWTTNAASSPYVVVPSSARHFYRTLAP